MNFVSTPYLAFLLGVFAVYWCLPRRGQNLLILVASYLFYAAWDWRLLGLIAISTVSNFVCGNSIARATDARLRRQWLRVAVSVNLGMLGWFKYAGFFATSLVSLVHAFGGEVGAVTLNIVLPVGISFYVFHSLSYTLDIYRGDLKSSDSLVDFAGFVAFFPQMVAGPIVRARELLFQLQAERHLSPQMVERGVGLCIAGLFLKAFVADNLALHLVDDVFAQPTAYATPTLWLALVGYGCQIYADFCGYSLMASGSALLLGITLPVNFRHPFLAASFAEFWQRWHISMSRFFRDYVYIALGGNRGSTPRTLANLSATALLSGLWHGASWTFVGWGAQHALLNCVDQLARRAVRNLSEGSRAPLVAWSLAPRWILVQLCVLLAWVLFRSRGFDTALGYYRGLFVWQDGLTVVPTLLIPACLCAVVLDHAYGWVQEHGVKLLPSQWLSPAAYAAMLLVTVNGMPSGATPFIYFQF